MEPEPGCLVGLSYFPPYLLLNVSFSLVQPSSHLTLCLYAKRSAHPDILIGSHEMPIPLELSTWFRFLENSLSSNQLNISGSDIPCVLQSDIGEAGTSTQRVTLYITVNITSPNLYNSPPCIPAEDDDTPAEEATIPGRIQFPVPERGLPLSHHQLVETGNTMPPRIRKICRPLVPRILVFLFIGPMNPRNGLSQLTDRKRGKGPSGGSSG